MGWIGFMVCFDFLNKEFCWDRISMGDWGLFDMYFGTEVGCDGGYKEISPHEKDQILVNGRWKTQRERMIYDHDLFLKVVCTEEKPIDITYDKIGRISAFLGLSPKAYSYIKMCKGYKDVEDLKEFDVYEGSCVEEDLVELRKLFKYI